MDFINDASPVIQSFWYIAIPSTVIFLIQTLMTFMGSDASDGLSADFQSDVAESTGPFQLFSFRNLINFLLGFSWTGIAYSSVITHQFLLISAALVSGLAFVGIFFLAMNQLQKLAEDNTFQIEKTLEKIATVYIHIPGDGESGKIQVSVQGAIHEINALSGEGPIPSGSKVKVTRIISESLVEVSKKLS